MPHHEPRTSFRHAAVALLVLALLAVAPPASAADAPPSQPATIGTALPPGNSGFISVPGQARGAATGDPGAYGEHIDDQREMFWDGAYKDGRFADVSGQTAQTPRDGVRIYEDDKGVPVVYGDTGYDVWFGAGYAAGQQRLFLADAVRRLGRGTYAELVGPGGVPVDVQTRTLGYSAADYDAMFAALPRESQTVFEAYTAGIDAWIEHVRRTPADLPAEYVLLSSLPERWELHDTLAGGVLLTRTVAATGGEEFREIEMLRTLQDALGQEQGLGAFTDLRWQQDEQATTTIPREEGLFAHNAAVPESRRAQVLRDSATYALSLPPELASGPGTGASARPTVPELPADSALVQRGLAAAVQSLEDFRLAGGSYGLVVSGSRTSTGAPMLVNGPQVGYSYPNQLFEIEVHGGGYDARGVIVPGLPTVGIGYGTQIAWGLTSGYSKTIDSFIETVRRVDGRLQYLHAGQWKEADCRAESIRYRQAPQGVPAGPPVFTTTTEICRTVHGPVVAYSDDGTLARSVSYAMYRRELDNVNGILAWNRADDLAEFEAGVRQLTWNENVFYAGADGHIGFWHPGLYPRRSPSWDVRFPAPGTGEHDFHGFLPFERMPHAVDPQVGYLANWNGKPAQGWVNDLMSPANSHVAGKAHRLQVIHELLAADASVTPEELRAMEYRLGVVDQRWPEFGPLLRSLRAATPEQAAALALLRSWDGTTYGPTAGTSPGSYTDPGVTGGPAQTLFHRFMDALRDDVLRDLPPSLVLESDAVGSHVWDASVADNLVLRILAPSRSSLRPSRDYLGGRTPSAALLDALDQTVAALTEQFGPDPADWRDQHPRRPVRSLTGVIGPSLTMPYHDRGSWVQVVAFDGPSSVAPPAQAAPTAPARAAAGSRLPATGAGTLALWGGLALLLAALVVRRRSGQAAVAHLDGVEDDDLAG